MNVHKTLLPIYINLSKIQRRSIVLTSVKSTEQERERERKRESRYKPSGTSI